MGLTGDYTAWQVAAALLASALVGLSKTGVAGAGILMVPVMASAFPAGAQAGLMLPVLVAGDCLAVAWYRRSGRFRLVLRTLPWAAAGIGLGYGLMKGCFADGAPWPVDERWLKRALGAVILALVAAGAWAARRAESRPEPDAAQPSGPAGAPRGGGASWWAPAIGLAAGVTTMVANAAGPFWIIYLLLRRLPKREFIGTSAWAFFILNWFKVPFSAGLGFLTAGTLRFNLAMLPGLLAGSALGIWALPRISQRVFDRAATALAAAGGAYLLLA